jgi:hypothetical protein
MRNSMTRGTPESQLPRALKNVQLVHKVVEKCLELPLLVKALHMPLASAGQAGTNRNVLPRRNTGAAIALFPERSG